MIILVINSGSSSIKYKLFEVATAGNGLGSGRKNRGVQQHPHRTCTRRPQEKRKNMWRRTGSPITIEACNGSWTS